MNKNFAGWRAELENLYVGWVYNPLIDLWNGFVDFHNGRVDRKTASRLVFSEDDEGLFATVNGRQHRIREHWFDKDFAKVLKLATRRQKKAAENQNLKKCPSKRQKGRGGAGGRKNH